MTLTVNCRGQRDDGVKSRYKGGKGKARQGKGERREGKGRVCILLLLSNTTFIGMSWAGARR